MWLNKEEKAKLEAIAKKAGLSQETYANSDKLISAGNLRLSDLGSMMGGRGGNNMDFPGHREPAARRSATK